MVSWEGIEPTKFDSMRKAAKAIGIRKGSLGMQLTLAKFHLEI